MRVNRFSLVFMRDYPNNEIIQIDEDAGFSVSGIIQRFEFKFIVCKVKVAE